MKNPHGVEPARLLKRRDKGEAIFCNSNFGPIFGQEYSSDIQIHDHCNEQKSCSIGNCRYSEYESHPQFESSLFVNTNDYYQDNRFAVLDYEVFVNY